MGNVQVYFAFLGFLLAIKPTLVRIIDELTMSNPAYFLVPPQELGVYCWISRHAAYPGGQYYSLRERDRHLHLLLNFLWQVILYPTPLLTLEEGKAKSSQM